jgi:dolichol kinase
VVIAACLYVIVGDTFATIIGKNIPSPRLFKQKTLIGSVGFLVGSSIAGLAFYLFTHFMPISTILIGALIATVLEALPLPFDDNFYVPIATGLFMSFL